MLSDFIILSRIKNGDINAFKEVFDKYYAPLCMYAGCILKDSDEAEEIVQELFYVLWKNHHSLSITHSLRSYLYSAVRNQSFQQIGHAHIVDLHRQSEKNSSQNTDINATPQHQLELSELEELVELTLSQMPNRCRQIFSMQRMEGKKYREIADDLHLSVKTVEADMTKTLKNLRVKIEKYYNS